MIPPVWSALKHYFLITRRDLQEDSYLFLPLKNNRTKNLDKPLDSSMIFYIVTKYSRLAGISNRVSPHSCRATAISNARDHQVPDRAIQEFAGWTSPDMITRYDKRKTAVEDSAAHAIFYGAEDRSIPVVSSREEALAEVAAEKSVELLVPQRESK
jgi:integrase